MILFYSLQDFVLIQAASSLFSSNQQCYLLMVAENLIWSIEVFTICENARAVSILTVLGYLCWLHGDYQCFDRSVWSDSSSNTKLLLKITAGIMFGWILDYGVDWGGGMLGGRWNWGGDAIHKALTHLPLDIMAAFSQTIFSDAFSWMKSFVFWLKFPWCLFLRVQLTIT